VLHVAIFLGSPHWHRASGQGVCPVITSNSSFGLEDRGLKFCIQATHTDVKKSRMLFFKFCLGAEIWVFF